MRLLLVLAAVFAVSCGGKKGNVGPTGGTTVTSEQTFSPGFIDLSFDDADDELDMMMGSELMQAQGECGNLLALEPMAMMGRLKDGEIRCLEEGYRDADKQTLKKKLSLVLMSDAWTKGDKHRWETIVRRHLEEVDQSDPDLCYKFALHLYRKGPENSEEVLKWADVSLENRSRFPPGDTHVNRVYGLLKLKAKAAAMSWASLEEEYLKAPSEEIAGERDEARNNAKTLAREWLEYARSSGKDDTVAFQMCVSASGNADFCSGA